MLFLLFLLSLLFLFLNFCYFFAIYVVSVYVENAILTVVICENSVSAAENFASTDLNSAVCFYQAYYCSSKFNSF